MTEKEKRKFIDYLRLENKLENACLGGTILMFEGKYGDAETIASACVFNDSGYYMDEITGGPESRDGVIFIERGDRKEQ